MSPAVAARLRAQLLAGPPAPSAAAVCERLLAVQAQDLRGARLAIRSRTRGLIAADVDRALTDGSLVVAWFNRGTLHLVRREDFWWLHALTTPQLIRRTLKRLAEEGVRAEDADRGIAVVERALADEGPLRREALRERLDAADVPTGGQALPHLLGLAGLRAVAVRGPIVAGGHAFVLVRDWLGEPEAVDRDRALAELARRYLAGHGPADDRDLARWAGMGLREARQGLRAVGDGRPARHDDAPATAPPKLLGPFDPLLLGWCSREDIVGEHRDLVTDNGVFRPFALVDGRAVGRWALRAGRVELQPFDAVPAAAREALRAEAADVERFLAA